VHIIYFLIISHLVDPNYASIVQFREDLYDSFALTDKEEVSFRMSLDDGSFLSETDILIGMHSFMARCNEILM
jgi:hypothetical protein